MTEKEVIDKLIQAKLSIEDKLNIFNWWLKNKSPCVILSIEGDSEEYLLSKQEVLKISNNKDLQLLEYSTIKIKEQLNVIPKSNLNLMMFLMGYR